MGHGFHGELLVIIWQNSGFDQQNGDKILMYLAKPWGLRTIFADVWRQNDQIVCRVVSSPFMPGVCLIGK